MVATLPTRCLTARQKKVKPIPVTPIDETLAADFEARFALRQDEVRRIFAPKA